MHHYTKFLGILLLLSSACAASTPHNYGDGYTVEYEYRGQPVTRQALQRLDDNAMVPYER